MSTRTKTTKTRLNEEVFMDLQEQHDGEEEMWPEGYTAREEQAYELT